MAPTARRRRPSAGARGRSRGLLITLTSDFGLHDPYVGIMKSRIIQRAPQARIVDLTHQITPFQPEEAGYWLWCCYRQFPRGTVHVAVVDPGVGSTREIAVLETRDQRFIAPDNGLLGLIAASDPEARAVRLDPKVLPGLGLALDSATFHGRDVMAPLAAELLSGRARCARLGPRADLLPGRLRAGARAADGSIEGSIAVIDHFGNGLTTIPSALLAAHAAGLQLELGGRRLRLVRTYAEAHAGEAVGLINSSSMLEVATREGSAARLLRLRPGLAVRVLPGA